jgi:dihydroorotate dehydrogenase electron transfer subunit
MKQFNAEILSNDVIAIHCHRLSFSWPKGLPAPLPGQFVNIRIQESTVPLLRRPFALSGHDPGASTGSVIFQKRGMGTEILSGKKPGEALDMIGPLGNSFMPFASRHSNILVAGGTGLGPVFFFAHELERKKLPYVFVFGTRSRESIPRFLAESGLKLELCTEDGSEGFKGMVTDFLKTRETGLSGNAALFSCGPHPMLKACAEFAAGKRIPCYVSMEQVMACGIGACMGCVVKTSHSESRFMRVCVDGPIFESGCIQWT